VVVPDGFVFDAPVGVGSGVSVVVAVGRDVVVIGASVLIDADVVVTGGTVVVRGAEGTHPAVKRKHVPVPLHSLQQFGQHMRPLTFGA
jgi:hypothetical protein